MIHDYQMLSRSSNCAIETHMPLQSACVPRAFSPPPLAKFEFLELLLQSVDSVFMIVEPSVMCRVSLRKTEQRRVCEVVTLVRG